MTSIPKTSGPGPPSSNTLRSRSTWAGGSSEENKVSGTGECCMAIPVSMVNSSNSRSALGNSSGCNHHAPKKVTVTGAGAGLRQLETMKKSRTMTKGKVFCNGRCSGTRMFLKTFLERSRFSCEFSSKTHFLFPHSAYHDQRATTPPTQKVPFMILKERTNSLVSKHWDTG